MCTRKGRDGEGKEGKGKEMKGKEREGKGREGTRSRSSRRPGRGGTRPGEGDSGEKAETAAECRRGPESALQGRQPTIVSYSIRL